MHDVTNLPPKIRELLDQRLGEDWQDHLHHHTPLLRFLYEAQHDHGTSASVADGPDWRSAQHTAISTGLVRYDRDARAQKITVDGSLLLEAWRHALYAWRSSPEAKRESKHTFDPKKRYLN